MNLTLTFVAEAHYERVRLLTRRSANVIISVTYIKVNYGVNEWCVSGLVKMRLLRKTALFFINA